MSFHMHALTHIHKFPPVKPTIAQPDGVLVACALATCQHLLYASVFYSRNVVKVREYISHPRYAQPRIPNLQNPTESSSLPGSPLPP